MIIAQNNNEMISIDDLYDNIFYKNKLRIYCAITSYIHFIQSIVVFSLWLSKKYILDKSLLYSSKTLMLWFSSNSTTNIYNNNIENQLSCNLIKSSKAMLNFQMAPIVIYNASFEPMVFIFIFWLLSFLFQIIQSKLWPFFKNKTYNTNSKLRFIEYSISASFMLITIALQLGITDIFTLVNMFFNCFSCMIFGLIAEYFIDVEQKIKLTCCNIPLSIISHLCGWITLGISYYPIYDVFYSSINCSNTGDKSIPDFVKIIVVIQSILFCIFGLVQTLGLILKKYGKNINQINITSDIAYTTLSLIAKSLLGWIVIGNTYGTRIRIA